MKTIKIVFFLLFAYKFIAINVIAQETIKITFKYKFIHVNDGFDHISRMKIYLDGNLIGTSNPDGTSSDASLTHKETTENIFAVEIPKGFHKLRAIVEAYYEGVWEEHLKENSYALDCLYEKSMDFSKAMNVELEFDIEKEITVIKKED